MKSYKLLLVMLNAVLLGLLFATSACQSVSTTDPTKIQNIAAFETFAVAQAVTPILVNNPKYEPVFVATADTVDAALVANVIVTPQAAVAFVDALALKYNMDDATRKYIASTIVSLAQLYAANYKQATIQVTDPNLIALITAFKDGIRQGVANYHLLNTPMPAGAKGP